jgi:hypothetical protein
MRIPVWGKLAAAADMHLGFKLSSSSLGTNFAFAAASNALCLNAPPPQGAR